MFDLYEIRREIGFKEYSSFMLATGESGSIKNLSLQGSSQVYHQILVLRLEIKSRSVQGHILLSQAMRLMVLLFGGMNW